MASLTKDLLRRDECQRLTQEQIADIKAQTVTRPKANVYIKPYEIMDLDGTEQVVGEVQKTIDGVKKKKPKYKRNVDLVMPNSSSHVYNWLGGGIEDLIELKGWLTDSSGFFAPFNPCYMTVFGFVYNPTLDDLAIQYDNPASWQHGRTAHITVVYTKTTDSWEVV